MNHWPPNDNDPKDVVTIVVTSNPDGYGKQRFWIRWHAGRHDVALHGWRAQHFHAKLDHYREHNWDGKRVVVVEESGAEGVRDG